MVILSIDEHYQGSLNPVSVAVVGEEVVVGCVEVDIFLAVASEGCVPRSEDRELALHGVDMNSSPCILTYAVVHRLMAAEAPLALKPTVT